MIAKLWSFKAQNIGRILCVKKQIRSHIEWAGSRTTMLSTLPIVDDTELQWAMTSKKIKENTIIQPLKTFLIVNRTRYSIL